MTTMLLLFGCVLALVLVNVPIAVSLGVVAVVAMVASHGTASLPNLALVTYSGATNFPLLAIPLFILAGAIMNASGISRRLIAWHRRCSGGSAAALRTFRSVRRCSSPRSPDRPWPTLPRWARSYPGDEGQGLSGAAAAAVMSSAATLAVIIPPSIPMILIRRDGRDLLVVQLFVAGIVPGVLADSS